MGEPTLVDPTPVAASQDTGKVMREAMGLPAGDNGVTAQASLKSGDPGPNEAAPRSDTPPASAPNDHPFARPAASADPNELKPTATADASELKPNAPPDPNELKPNADAQTAGDQAAPPPVQVNEIQSNQSSSTATATADANTLASDQEISSSKKKKKSTLKKVVPF
jgi:hypothetical protein